MKVSIITATYNSQNCIAHCIESVLFQDYNNIEHIIVDGVSKDQTLNIIKSYQNNKRSNIILTSEHDKGIYDALNKGISKATGAIVGFVHSDDMLSTETIISQIVRTFKTFNCDGVYGDLEYVDKHNTDRVIRYWKSRNFTRSLLKRGWMPAHPTLFLKKDVYNTHGVFNLNYTIAADYDFILRVFNDPNRKFAYLPEVITKMRIGGASNRSIKNIALKTKEDFIALKKNKVGGIYSVLIKNVSKLEQFYKKQRN